MPPATGSWKAIQDVRRAEISREVAKLDLDVAREQLFVLLALWEEGRATLRQVEEARAAEMEKWLVVVRVKVFVINPGIADRNHNAFAFAHRCHHYCVAFGQQRLRILRRHSDRCRAIEGFPIPNSRS